MKGFWAFVIIGLLLAVIGLALGAVYSVVSGLAVSTLGLFGLLVAAVVMLAAIPISGYVAYRVVCLVLGVEVKIR